MSRYTLNEDKTFLLVNAKNDREAVHLSTWGTETGAWLQAKIVIASTDWFSLFLSTTLDVLFGIMIPLLKHGQLIYKKGSYAILWSQYAFIRKVVGG